MKKILTILVTITLLFACDNSITQSPNEKVDLLKPIILKPGIASEENQINEERLSALAKSLAVSLKTSDFGLILKEEIGKKFDGDYNVLWNTLEKHPSYGGISTYIDLTLKKNSHSLDIISSISKLQIALPVGFDEWDGTSAILVAYTPLTSDDLTWKTIYAFDSEGIKHELNAQITPDFPVLVVSLNERVNTDGEVVYGNRIATSSGALPKTSVTYDYELWVDSFRLMKDNEPWTLGYPEIYVNAQDYYKFYQGWTTDFLYVDKEKLYTSTDQSWLPKRIYGINVTSLPSNGRILVHVKEEDSGANDTVETDWRPYSLNDPRYPYVNDLYQCNVVLSPYWFYGANHQGADLKLYEIQ